VPDTLAHLTLSHVEAKSMSNELKNIIVALVLGLLGATAAVAQAPPEMRLLKQHIGRMALQISGGRILNNSPFYFGNFSSSFTNGVTKEQICFHRNGTAGWVNYERTGPDGDFSLETGSDGRFQFRSSSKTNAKLVPVEFRQTAGEPLVLKVGRESRQQVYRADTLWQLMIVQPEECKHHLVPVLEALRPEWKLDRSASVVEQELLKVAAAGKQSNRQQWAAWVEQLGDNHFVKREAADKQLRTTGAGVLPYLRRLDYAQLDAEQQFRLRRIMKALSKQTSEDTPEHVAVTLFEEPTIWWGLLSRPEESTRREAARRLTAILGGPIGLDPAAQPATQVAARAEVRARIERQEKRREAISPKSAAGKPAGTNG
jgi:hypothetical protein